MPADTADTLSTSKLPTFLVMALQKEKAALEALARMA
jgi:hypothetical protein